MRKTVFLAIVIAVICVAAISGGLLIFSTAKNRRAARAESAGRVSSAARVSVASVGGAENSANGSYGSDLSGSGLYPAFSLEADETLIQIVNSDINLDGTYDQVCAVRRGAEPEIYIVCAIQNPLTMAYTRLEPIRTGVTQARTLLIYFSDVTGQQENALVYSGMNSENLQVLGIFSITEDADTPGGFRLREMLNLSADGAIQVEETRRSNAYNLGMAAGASYPVVSYHSAPAQEETPSSLEQIRRTYAWNPSSGVYELSSERRVSAESANAMVVQRLREEGNEALFSFLKGIWYKSENPSSGAQLGFNLEANEIIFTDGQAQEVFRSESISARRYGVYLVARNSLISSIRRLVDIEITGANEIQIRTTEDVSLRIGVDSAWNGSYRRMRSDAVSSPANSAQRIATILEGSGFGWTDTLGTAYLFASGVLAAESAEGKKEEYRYAIYMIRENPVMQVKDASGENTFYFLREDSEGRIAMQEISASASGFKEKAVPEITLAPLTERTAAGQARQAQ